MGVLLAIELPSIIASASNLLYVDGSCAIRAPAGRPLLTAADSPPCDGHDYRFRHRYVIHTLHNRRRGIWILPPSLIGIAAGFVIMITP